MTSRIWRAVAACLLLIALAGAAGLAPAALHQAQSPRTGVPRFETGACPFKPGAGMVVGRTLICGYLVVPEDRTAHNNRTIRLAMAVFKSPFPNPAPDPVVFLQGGPGGAILSQIGPFITRDTAPVIVGQRDFILIDQRGDGYSKPALSCQELTDLKYKYLASNVSDDRQLTLQDDAARRCRDRLVRAGDNPNAYTSLADAADVADLRVALGYRSMNLYGVSYGTRIALTVMRSFPQGIRSVVLDSVFPPQINGYSDVVTSGKRAFDVLFKGCASDAACNRAYPKLESVFYSLVNRLNAKPFIFTSKALDTGKSYRVLLNGDGLVDVLFQALYSTDLIPSLPAMIDGIAHGEYAVLANVYGQTGFDDSLNVGTYYAVQCGEDAPYVTSAHIAAAIKKLPQPLQSSQRLNILGDLSVCAFWGAKKVPAAQKTPVTSGIPTLVLAGQYDPITPPANSMLAAKTLSHGYFFMFPGTGHGVYLTNLCPIRMTAAFWDNPNQRPDAGCIAGMSGPKFVLPKRG